MFFVHILNPWPLTGKREWDHNPDLVPEVEYTATWIKLAMKESE